MLNIETGKNSATCLLEDAAEVISLQQVLFVLQARAVRELIGAIIQPDTSPWKTERSVSRE